MSTIHMRISAPNPAPSSAPATSPEAQARGEKAKSAGQDVRRTKVSSLSSSPQQQHQGHDGALGRFVWYLQNATIIYSYPLLKWRH
ncbi:hypothetical protein PVAG01_09699 [Phlyctema vagabunda]|uniref:Uncharacterized protein n=1 Tax=Phlyctema vagabunda TaxID=108571 RepID=A0ABR4P825_9HELO